MRQLILIAHNVRSCHNVGSLLRTAEGLGVKKVYLTGYTPYPETKNDSRLPHIALQVSKRIHKTALGAETMVNWQYEQDIQAIIKQLKTVGFEIIALEQVSDAKPINKYTVPEKLVLIVGREVEGLESDVVAAADEVLEIPMFGKKESFNVVQAAAMVLFHFRFQNS